jgi:hypothetical protein
VGTYPAVAVQFAPGIASSVIPSSGDWVDLTGRLISLDIRHGREDEFSQPSAGTLELELDNGDGALDPDNTSGPYYGDLLPLTWVRVLAGTTTATTDVFYGQVTIDGWRLPASQHRGQMVARVTVRDLLEQLANADLPESVWEYQVGLLNPLTWWRLGETSGTVMVDSSGNGHHGAYNNGETFYSRTGLVEGSSDPAIDFSGLPGATLNLTEHPTAALTSFPFFVSFATSAPAVTGGPTSGPIFWQQVGSGFVTIQHAGTAGALVGAADNALLVLVNDGAGNRRYWYTPDFTFDGQAHEVFVEVLSAGAVFVHVDGANTSASNYSSVGSEPSVPPGSGGQQLVGNGTSNTGVVIDEVIVGDTPPSWATIEDLGAVFTDSRAGETTDERITFLLDAVGFDAGHRTVAAGNSTVQGAVLDRAPALGALQDIAKAENGYLYVDHHDGGKLRFVNRQARWTDSRSTNSQATLGDGAGEVTYDAADPQDDRILNVATYQRSGGAAATAEDATSRNQYQRRSVNETGLLYETDAESEYRANLIVAEKKDRRRRVRSVTLAPSDDAHPAWAHVFARQLGDRITVKWRPPYGGTYSYPSFIEGIHHSWRASGETPWTTTFSVSPVPYGGAGTAYWLLGTSVLGTDTRPGY